MKISGFFDFAVVLGRKRHKTVTLRENPFQLQNASRSALKLRFLIGWGYVGLPIRETRIGALSSACGRRARFANAQALLAISDFHHAESRTAGA